MNKDQMISYLLDAIETSDSVSGDHILVRKKVAIELVQMLSGEKPVSRPAKNTDGKTLFYCADCGKSFWDDPQEDEACFAKYQYHTWYASCPFCKREVSQNDRYWR